MPKTMPPSDTRGTRPYFPELDGVRALAVAMVMLFHLAQLWKLKNNMILGQTGVDLFFVLSGFLITTILLQAPHGDWHEIRNFYIRRTLRIFPLYYGYLIVASLFSGTVSIWYWVYLQNIAPGFHRPLLLGPGHFWSLAVEEQFYLVWPFLVLFCPRGLLARAMWSLVVFSIAFKVVAVLTIMDPFYLTFSRLDGLAGGGLLAYYMKQGNLRAARGKLILLSVLSIVTLGVGWKFSHASGAAWAQVTKLSAGPGAYIGLIGLILVTGDSLLHRMLRSRPLRAVGRVSYGMYVFHPAILFYMRGRLVSAPLLLREALSFGLVYLVSWASFYGFEKRFTDLKQKLAPEKPFKNVAEPLQAAVR